MSFWSAVGDVLGSGNFWSTALQAGGTLLANQQQRESQEAQLQRQDDAQKLQAQLELARLRFGNSGGGGGGGSARNANEDLISALQSGQQLKSTALDSFARNYVAALR